MRCAGRVLAPTTLASLGPGVGSVPHPTQRFTETGGWRGKFANHSWVIVASGTLDPPAAPRGRYAKPPAARVAPGGRSASLPTVARLALATAGCGRGRGLGGGLGGR